MFLWDGILEIVMNNCTNTNGTRWSPTDSLEAVAKGLGAPSRALVVSSGALVLIMKEAIENRLIV